MSESICKFCLGGRGHHTSDCARNDPGSEDRFEEGYRLGRSGALALPRDADRAYMSGYRAGEIALESAQNGSPW